MKINAVKIIKEFNFNRIFGQIEFFPYQIALGISVRYLKCERMGWMFRIYLGPIKVWFNLKGRRTVRPWPWHSEGQIESIEPYFDKNGQETEIDGKTL